jgi:hypothetical protein
VAEAGAPAAAAVVEEGETPDREVLMIDVLLIEPDELDT